MLTPPFAITELAQNLVVGNRIKLLTKTTNGFSVYISNHAIGKTQTPRHEPYSMLLNRATETYRRD